MRQLECPGCGKVVRYPRRRAGKTIPCAGCGRSLTLPASTPPSSVAAATPRRVTALRLAVAGVLVLGVGLGIGAVVWSRHSGDDRVATGTRVASQFPDLGPFVAIHPATPAEVAKAPGVTVDLDNPALSPKLAIVGKMV